MVRHRRHRRGRRGKRGRRRKGHRRHKRSASTSGGLGARRKRAMPAYMYFCKNNRKHILAQHPNLSFGQVGRLLGKEWRRLSDKEKQPYIQQAERARRGGSGALKRRRA